MIENAERAPLTYVWRRLHSLFGLLIVVFLFEHIVTNSQAALLLGDNGAGFIRMVNLIKNLPYLPVIEIFLIGVPIAFHGVLGIKYALTGKVNSLSSNGSKPSLKKYSRNHAYTWQRLTSWILLVGIILHVGYMRFYRYPTHAMLGNKTFYFTRISLDKGLYTLAKRLDVTLYSKEKIQELKSKFEKERPYGKALEKKAETVGKSVAEPKDKHELEKVIDRIEGYFPTKFNENTQNLLVDNQSFQQRENWVATLTKKPVTNTEVIACCEEFGTATLLMVRDSFKSPLKSFLYTIFVLAASFHAFNGLWTFCITWGFVIKMRSQKTLVNICIGAMALIAILGLFAVWGTYWVNLYH